MEQEAIRETINTPDDNESRAVAAQEQELLVADKEAPSAIVQENESDDAASQEEPSDAQQIETALAEEATPIETVTKTTKPKAEKKNSALSIEHLTSAIASEDDVLKKIDMIISFLRNALSHREGPFFREFWEARRIALELFSVEIMAEERAGRWAELDSLYREARSLKDVEDEQSKFAAEQIELALVDVESGIATLDKQLDDAPRAELVLRTQEFLKNKDVYERIQGMLNISNTYAARINSLRKELIKIEIRIRDKNALFKRLSAAGDSIFPRRKELIKELSTHFVADVDAFIARSFSDGKVQGKIYDLRDEVKALQSLAKTLTLNTHVFTGTRKKLSACWDMIKEGDKERRKERNEQREQYKEGYDLVIAKIVAFEEEYAKGEMTDKEVIKSLEEISDFMRTVKLAYDHVKELKTKLASFRKEIDDKQKAEEDRRREKADEVRKEKIEKIQALKDAVETLARDVSSYDIDDALAQKSELSASIYASDMKSAEKTSLERRLRVVDDMVAAKKEERLMALSSDDRDALAALLRALKEKRNERRAVKAQLDEYQRSKAMSGLDFNKALTYSELVLEEKGRLSKADESIVALERKIADIKK